MTQPTHTDLPERDPGKPAARQGLFRKFDVRRVDGSDQPGGKHHGCRYFVLDVDHDQFAAAALTAYAAACQQTHPELARDLRQQWGAATSLPHLAVMEAEIAAARKILARLCDNGLVRMSIPVQPDDEDIILSAVIERAAAAVSAAPAEPVAFVDGYDTDDGRVIRHIQQIGHLDKSLPLGAELYLAAGVAPAAPADQADALDAARYRWLRNRDLDAISQGGVFAGMTPEDVVLNGDDLDKAIDAAIDAQAMCGKGAA